MRNVLLAALMLACLTQGAWAQTLPAATAASPDAVASCVQSEIEGLSSKDPQRQAMAMFFLARMGPKAAAATPFILPLLKSPGPSVTVPFAKAMDLGDLAADTVVHIGPGATKYLLAAVKDGEFIPRREAVKVMGRLRDPAAIGALIEIVKDRQGSKTLLVYACDALVQIGPPAIGALLTQLDHPSMGIRQEVQGVLGRIGRPAVTPLAALCEDPNPVIRRSVAGALDRIDDAQATPYLVKMLKDPDAKVREKAAAGLSYPTSNEAMEALLQTVRSEEDTDVRVVAEQALGEFDAPGAVAALTSIMADANRNTLGRCWAIEAIEKKKSPLAVEALIRTLSDKDHVVRARAAEALGAFKNAQAVEPLIAMLGDKLQHVRAAAVRALGRIGDHRADKPLMAMMNDVDENVREDAARSLGQLKCAAAIDLLIAALRDDDWETRMESARALGVIGDARSAGPLLEALKTGLVQKTVIDAIARMEANALEPLLAAAADPDGGLRAAAMIMLAKNPGARASAALVAGLKDPSALVRLQAAVAIKGRPCPEAIAPLVAMLNEQDLTTAEVALDDLGGLGDANAVEAIVTSPLIDNEALRPFATAAMASIGKDAIPALKAALGAQRVSTRLAAAEALARMPEPAAAPVLLALLKDEDARLRAMAAAGLGNARLKSAPPELVDALNDGQTAVRRSAAAALGMIKDPAAVKPLAATLNYGDAFEKAAAAEALAAIGQTAPLIDAMEHGSWSVRELAREALRRITNQDFGQDAARWRQFAATQPAK